MQYKYQLELNYNNELNVKGEDSLLYHYMDAETSETIKSVGYLFPVNETKHFLVKHIKGEFYSSIRITRFKPVLFLYETIIFDLRKDSFIEDSQMVQTESLLKPNFLEQTTQYAKVDLSYNRELKNIVNFFDFIEVNENTEVEQNLTKTFEKYFFEYIFNYEQFKTNH